MSDLISRQDAKDVVDMELDAIDHVPEWVYDRLLTALDKVPSAQPELAQNLHTTCTDAISRQAAIDALEQIFDQCEEIEAHLPEGDPDRTGYKMYPDYMTVWKYLHQLPSAQPECKRGRWVQIQVRTAPHNRISKVLKCSVCGKRKDKYVTWNYCPNCGADMREGDAE